MGQVANNLVDLAEFRRRRAHKEAERAVAAPAPVSPTPYQGFPVAMRMMTVPCIWVPVWVQFAAPTYQHRTESCNG